MKSNEFLKPYFLGDQIKIGPVENEGQVVAPKFIEGILPHIKEKIPDFDGEHYIIKQYGDYDSSFFADDIKVFEQDQNEYQLTTHDPSNLSLVDKYMILERRQSELKRFLGSELSDMVLESYFFIAKSDDGFKLYEIQKRMPSHEVLSDVDPNFIDKLDQSAQFRFKYRAQLFLEKLKQILNEKEDPYYKRFIPDLNQRNVAILEDGKVVLFDTNYNFPRSSLHGRRGVEYTFHGLYDLIKKIK